MIEKKYTWTISYIDNHNTHYVVSDLNDHQKEAFLSGLKDIYYLPVLGQMFVFTDTIVVEKVTK